MISCHRLKLRAGGLVLAAWLVCGGVVRSDESTDLLPVPNAADLATAEATLKDVYKEDFRRATTADKMFDLARTLLEQGLNTKTATAEKYALYQAALNLAVTTGNVPVAFKAIDATAATYQVDALKLKTETLTRILKLPADAKKRQQQLEHVLALVDLAVAADSYDSAVQILTIAISAARSARDFDRVKQFVLRLKEVELQEKALAKVEAALKTLETQPTDPTANLEAGRFRCLQQGDWAAGLPMLALSADPKLGSLAQSELSNPKTPTEQLKLADEWWDLSQKETGGVKKQLQKHAVSWYAAAAPGLDGLLKTKAEKRLADVGGEPIPSRLPLPVLLSKLKPLHAEDFSSPASGMEQISKPEGRAGYQDGMYRIEATPGQHLNLGVRTPWDIPSSFACRITARGVGTPPMPAWGMIISNLDRTVGFGLWVRSDGFLEIDRGFGTSAGPINKKPFPIPNLNKGEAWNTLVVLVKDNSVEVYVNDTIVGEPVTINEGIWPARPCLRAVCSKQGRIEFKELAIWPADKLPTVRPDRAH